MREHHAFWFAGGSRSVDDGSQLAGKNLRSAHTISGDFRATRGSDQSFVAQTVGGKIVAGIGDDNLFELRKFDF